MQHKAKQLHTQVSDEITQRPTVHVYTYDYILLKIILSNTVEQFVKTICLGYFIWNQFDEKRKTQKAKYKWMIHCSSYLTIDSKGLQHIQLVQ